MRRPTCEDTCFVLEWPGAVIVNSGERQAELPKHGVRAAQSRGPTLPRASRTQKVMSVAVYAYRSWSSPGTSAGRWLFSSMSVFLAKPSWVQNVGEPVSNVYPCSFTLSLMAIDQDMPLF